MEQGTEGQRGVILDGEAVAPKASILQGLPGKSGLPDVNAAGRAPGAPRALRGTVAIILRYFDCQGRAQALRHALADAGAPFEDVRVPLATWPGHKNDPDFAGWFGGLPTLTWDNDTIAETLPIASYVARRLGDYDGLDAGAIARLEAVTSACYVDVVTRLADLLWADVLYPGVSFAAAVPRPLARAIDKVARVGALLSADGWIGGARPKVADFFLAESVELLCYFVGPEREGALRGRLPGALEHAERVRARPALALAWTARPKTFTASPDEVAAVARVHALDLSAIGLP